MCTCAVCAVCVIGLTHSSCLMLLNELGQWGQPSVLLTQAGMLPCRLGQRDSGDGSGRPSTAEAAAVLGESWFRERGECCTELKEPHTAYIQFSAAMIEECDTEVDNDWVFIHHISRCRVWEVRAWGWESPIQHLTFTCVPAWVTSVALCTHCILFNYISSCLFCTLIYSGCLPMVSSILFL